LGSSAELLAEQHGISRDAQDAFAARSHQRAAAAWDGGVFDGEIVAVPGFDLARDETLRADTTAEGLAGLKPVFAENGTVTAGNSSSLNDGASMVLLGAEGALPG